MYFYLKQPNKDSETLVILKYYVSKENKYYTQTTNLKINPKDWSKENRLPKLKRGGDSYKNRRITDELIRLNEKLNKAIDSHGKELTIGHLKKHFSKKKQDLIYVEDFWSAFIKHKIELQEVEKETIQKYNVVFLKFKEFQLKYKVKYKLADLNNDFYSLFISYLRNHDKLYDNTLHRYFNFFKSCLLWIEKKGYKLNTDYKNYSIKKHETNDVHLTEEELKLLEEVELTGSKLRARDLFLIGAYTGQRFSDYTLFKKSDVINNRIEKRAVKTQIKSYIPISDKLEVLLNKWDWRLPKISNQKFNKNIKEVCKLAEFTDEITKSKFLGNQKIEEIKPLYMCIGSHTARRTFITNAANKGVPDHIIMAICGIRNPATLKTYKKFQENELEKWTNNIF